MEELKNNERLKMTMYRYRISQWRLAEHLGVSENTVNRKLRKEMSDDDYKVYSEAINDLREE